MRPWERQHTGADPMASQRRSVQSTPSAPPPAQTKVPPLAMNTLEVMSVVVVASATLLICFAGMHRRNTLLQEEERRRQRQEQAAGGHGQGEGKGVPKAVRDSFRTVVYSDRTRDRTAEERRRRELEADTADAMCNGTKVLVQGTPGSGTGDCGANSLSARICREGNPSPSPSPSPRPRPSPSSGKGSSGTCDMCCVVCLGEFEDGETLLELPCLHQFHAECVSAWLDTHCTCPTCRMSLLPLDKKEKDGDTGTGSTAAATGQGRALSPLETGVGTEENSPETTRDSVVVVQVHHLRQEQQSSQDHTQHQHPDADSGHSNVSC